MAMLPSTNWLFGDSPDFPERPHQWAHCHDCGARIGWSEASCPTCGETQRQVETDRTPRKAALLSAVLPGAGHFYLGSKKLAAVQGFTFVALVGVALSQGSYLGFRVENVGQAALHASQWLALAGASAYEAGKRARRANHGLALGNKNPETCHRCDWPNPDDASFCRGCGGEFPDAGPGTTEFRVETRDGACFCEECTRQVSPSDRLCPSCGYELRVESPIPA